MVQVFGPKGWRAEDVGYWNSSAPSSDYKPPAILTKRPKFVFLWHCVKGTQWFSNQKSFFSEFGQTENFMIFEANHKEKKLLWEI